MAEIILDKIEKIVGKEENAGYQYFLLFPQCFQEALSSGSLKVGNVGVKMFRLSAFALVSMFLGHKTYSQMHFYHRFVYF